MRTYILIDMMLFFLNFFCKSMVLSLPAYHDASLSVHTSHTLLRMDSWVLGHLFDLFFLQWVYILVS